MPQGGTCIFMGDEAGLLDQAAALAEKKLKCAARFGSAPVFQEGFNRARFSNLHADARCGSRVATLFSLAWSRASDQGDACVWPGTLCGIRHLCGVALKCAG